MKKFNPKPHLCFGEKSVLEVYPETLGLGKYIDFSRNDGPMNTPNQFFGEIKTCKEYCFVCGKTYLTQITFPINEKI